MQKVKKTRWIVIIVILIAIGAYYYHFRATMNEERNKKLNEDSKASSLMEQD